MKIQNQLEKETYKRLKDYLATYDHYNELGGNEELMSLTDYASSDDKKYLEIERLHSRLRELEEVIMNSFGLPHISNFRFIIIDMGVERDVDATVKELFDNAEWFLSSTPRTTEDILQDSLKEGRPYHEVLPLFGLTDNMYCMFYYEEKFKKGERTCAQMLEDLKSIPRESHEILGKFKADIDCGIYITEDRMKEIIELNIPYTNEYLKYEPVFPC